LTDIPVPDDLIDALLPRKMLIKKITKNMHRLAKDLATGNVENLSWVTLQNLDDTFRKFTSEFDNKLKGAIEATEGALLEAMKRSEEHETGSAVELENLKKRIESVTELISGLKRHSL
jgi:seryl-tRNA synthetase